MQIISNMKGRVEQFVGDNATTLLTAGGVVGVVGTGVLAWRGGYKTAQAVDANTPAWDPAEPTVPTELPYSEKLKLSAPHVVPPVVTGSLTIGAIVLSHRMSGQKAAALAAAYGLSQKQLEEYKDKITEKLGVKKEQTMQDELAQERVNETPGHNQIVILEGEVLCFDRPTGRYFRSTMEKINSAVNCTNQEINNHEYASASFFYEELGLPATTWTEEVGWNRDRLLELSFSTVLSPDDKPCIAIDFKSLPKLDYIPRHY